MSSQSLLIGEFGQETGRVESHTIHEERRGGSAASLRSAGKDMKMSEWSFRSQCLLETDPRLTEDMKKPTDRILI